MIESNDESEEKRMINIQNHGSKFDVGNEGYFSDEDSKT